MKCPICKKELLLPPYAWRNVENYRERVLVVTKCCEKPIVLGPDMRYTATEYIGTRTEDDWGMEIPQ